MNGQESLWGWLGVGVLASAVGSGMVVLLADWTPALAAGFVVATLGGLLTSICVVGLGVTAGMLRAEHLRRR